MRITSKDVKIVFERFARAHGKRIAKSYDDVGAWRLDYAPVYGGYIIEEISTPSGGVNHPITSGRMGPSEFYHAMHFALGAMESRRRSSPHRRKRS